MDPDAATTGAIDMTSHSASQDTEDEAGSKSLQEKRTDNTVMDVDEPQESAVDEDDEEEVDEEDEEEEDEDDEVDSDELSDNASMLRMMQSLPENEARRHEQFRRSHFERGVMKRVRVAGEEGRLSS